MCHKLSTCSAAPDITLNLIPACHARFASRAPTSGNIVSLAQAAAWSNYTPKKRCADFPAPPDWDALRNRLETVSIGGRQAATFCPEHMLVLLSVHGAKHFWNRLSWISDIAELIRVRPALDWQQSQTLAAAMGCRRMWLWRFCLPAKFWTRPCRQPIIQQIAHEPGIAALRKRVEQQLLSPDATDPSAPQRLAFRLRSHETIAQGLRQCIRVSTRPTEDDWRACPLPTWATPLYVALRPLRLLRKYGFGFRRTPPPPSPAEEAQPCAPPPVITKSATQ